MPRLASALAVLVLVSAAAACSSSDEPTPASASSANADAGGGGEDGGAGGDGASGGDAKAGDATPARPPSSGGSGGLTCARKDDLGGGRVACVVKVGSVELKVLEPKPTSAPLRLGLYLHGDGAGAHKSGSALKAMIAWSDAVGGLGVSALAPNGCAWWQAPSHDCAASVTEPDASAANAAALATALESVTKAYDVRLDGARYYGSSGGSIFLTDEWIPLHGATHPGVLALMCGGSTPGRAYAWDMTDATLRAKVPLFFTYGDQDFLLGDIEDAIKTFGDAKFSVTKKVVPGAMHCAFDGHAEAMAIWSAAP